MGILVICSYKFKPGREADGRALLAEHVPLLRKHDLVTARATVQAEGKDGAVVEIFEWTSEEKSRSANDIPEIGALWKAMSETMDFVPLASLAESQRAFAHFFPF
jgi:hypothetical protein